MSKGKLIFLVTEDWYFCSHRIPIARAAKKYGFEIVVATKFSNHREKIINEGFRPFSLNYFTRETINPFIWLMGFLEILILYWQEKPKIVHHVSLVPVILGSIAAKLTGKIKIVNAITGLGSLFAYGEEVKYLRLIIGQCLRMCLKNTTIIVQNPDDANQLINSRFASRKKINLIKGSGVNMKKFKILPEPKEKKFTVGLVSRMLWQKGIGDFVEAIRILNESGENVQGIIAGGPHSPNSNSISHEKLEEWNQLSYINWVGKINDVTQVWKKAQISVLPSYYREGLPKSLLESASCGRAIITTDCPGCREIVSDMKSGLVVPAKSPKQLAKAILLLKKDKELRIKLAKNCYQLVKNELCEEIVMKKTLALYQKLTK